MRNLFGNSITPEQRDKSEGKERNDDTNKDRGAKVIATRGRYFERRIKSELALEDAMPWHFEKGIAYHCFFVWRCRCADLFAGQ